MEITQLQAVISYIKLKHRHLFELNQILSHYTDKPRCKDEFNLLQDLHKLMKEMLSFMVEIEKFVNQDVPEFEKIMTQAGSTINKIAEKTK